MRVLDLFCGAGGISMGWHRAGCDVTGVDIQPQPHYPFRFIQADALSFPLDGFDVIVASPPCQHYSILNNIQARIYPDLISDVRARLQGAKTPYVIENVAGAPLKGVGKLCGSMFGMRLFRHRYFESNIPLSFPSHVPHSFWELKAPRTGRAPNAGEVYSPYGNFADSEGARVEMGIDWYMTYYEVAQAIPPIYAEYIARQALGMPFWHLVQPNIQMPLFMEATS